MTHIEQVIKDIIYMAEEIDIANRATYKVTSATFTNAA